MIEAKIIADSVWKTRITTWVLTYPRFIHAEFMTHRAFSRNAASSRAIPNKRILEQPVALPVYWGKNQPGMQAREEVDDPESFQREWLELRDIVAGYTQRWAERGLHKQLANRPLEPFLHITVICTATDWDGFFEQRAHPDAQPEFGALARLMQSMYLTHEPTRRELHIPFDESDEPDLDRRMKIAVGRCARVSYLNHDGKRDPEEDVRLHDKLLRSSPPHLSPFEHVARAARSADVRSGNFRGWRQYRQYATNH